MEKGLEPLEVLPPTSQQKLLSYSFWVWYKFLLLESFNLIIQSTKEDWKLPWGWTCKTFKWSKTKVSHWSCSAMENPCKEPPSILQPKSVLKDVELSTCNHVLQVWPFREYQFFLLLCVQMISRWQSLLQNDSMSFNIPKALREARFTSESFVIFASCDCFKNMLFILDIF